MQLSQQYLATHKTNATAEAGMPVNTAFALGLITSALQTIFVMLSWILTTYLGRRTIYLWGSGFNALLLVCLGIAASFGDSDAANLAQASLGLIVSVLFTLGPAFVSPTPTMYRRMLTDQNPGVVGDNWRNLVNQTSTAHYGHRERLLLLSKHPVYLPGELHAQPRGA